MTGERSRAIDYLPKTMCRLGQFGSPGNKFDALTSGYTQLLCYSVHHVTMSAPRVRIPVMVITQSV